MEKEHNDYTGMIVIHGTLYEFDKINNRLTVHDDQQTRIDLKDLDWSTKSVSGIYGHETKMLMGLEFYLDQENEEGEIARFSIPRQLMDHKERDSLTSQQIQKLNEESLKNNHGFYLVDAGLSKRLNGELNEVQFDGITYIADLQNLQIRQKEKPEIKFELTNMEILSHGEFLYNTRTKTPCRIDPRISAMPDDVIAIRLLNIARIDIVGFAKYVGIEPTAFVPYYEWSQSKLNTETIHLHETKIPELIRRNQIEQEKMPQKQSQPAPSKRKRGRHL